LMAEGVNAKSEVTNNLVFYIRLGIIFIIHLIILFMINNLIIALAISAIEIYLSYYFYKKRQLIEEDYYTVDELGSVQGYFGKLINEEKAHRELQVTNSFIYVERRYKDTFKPFYNAYKKVQHKEVFIYFLNCLMVLILFLASLVSSYSLGNLNSQLIVASAYINYLFFESLQRVYDYFEYDARSLRILEYYDELYVEEFDTEVSDFSSISFRNIEFGYNENLVFEKLNFEINKGERIMIEGANGSGKSTLVSIIGGLYPCENIYIDDQKIDNRSLRNLVAIVNQSFDLYEITVKENLFSDDDKLIAEVFKDLELDEAINKDDLMGKMHEGGVDYSFGQRQRLCIARLLLSKRPIWILDEASASLDYVFKQKLGSLLDKYGENKTIIVISHDYDDLLEYDRVIKL